MVIFDRDIENIIIKHINMKYEFVATEFLFDSFIFLFCNLYYVNTSIKGTLKK